MTMPPAPVLLAFSFFVAMVLSTQFVGGLEVGVAGVGIVALVIGALAVHEVHVSHGVVIVLAKLQRLVEQADALLDAGGVVLP